MAELEIRNLHVTAEGKEILKGVSLDVEEGSIHARRGPTAPEAPPRQRDHGRHPSLAVTDGTITFKGEDITEADPDERSRMGLFMAFQYPIAIPGVTVAKYLRMIVNSHREGRRRGPGSSSRTSAGRPRRRWPSPTSPRSSPRYLNEGFSGGEKKRMEILQLVMLQPDMAVLDETDGLNIHALRVVAEGVNKFARPGRAS